MSQTETGDLSDLIFSAKGAQCLAGAAVGYFAGGRSLLWAFVGGLGALKIADALTEKAHASEPALLDAESAGSRKALVGALRSTSVATSYGSEALRQVTNLPVSAPKPVLMTPSSGRGTQVFLKPPVFTVRPKGK